jgi:hypothetical protein
MALSICGLIQVDFPETPLFLERMYDYDHEEYYFMLPTRVDENGVKHGSFRIIYSLYKE